MKLVYCAECEHVSTKASLEPERCDRCHRAARPVRVSYPWQYFAGVTTVLAGAIFLVLPQVAGGLPWEALTATLPLRLGWLVAFLAAGLYLANWGVRIMKAIALERGRQLYPGAGA